MFAFLTQTLTQTQEQVLDSSDPYWDNGISYFKKESSSQGKVKASDYKITGHG
eukprot:JP448959.1.p1 GENE.JP448959.1~~JP448959.1.p1  ORF type:complete len:53 (+),score=6.41 JP448959.1:34-192(+)